MLQGKCSTEKELDSLSIISTDAATTGMPISTPLRNINVVVIKGAGKIWIKVLELVKCISYNIGKDVG